MLINENLNINKAFYVIDLNRDTEDFTYIFLEEESDNPQLYCAHMPEDDDRGHFFSLEKNLSEYIYTELKYYDRIQKNNP
jgi:hypothetical protein